MMSNGHCFYMSGNRVVDNKSIHYRKKSCRVKQFCGFVKYYEVQHFEFVSIGKILYRLYTMNPTALFKQH